MGHPHVEVMGLWLSLRHQRPQGAPRPCPVTSPQAPLLPIPAPQPASSLVSPHTPLPYSPFSGARSLPLSLLPPAWLSLSLSLLLLLPLTLFSTWARTWALPYPAKATWPHTKQSLVPPESSPGFACHRLSPLETFASLGGFWADCTGHRGSAGWEVPYL